MHEKATYIFWSTLILYIITLMTVSYVGVYLTYIAIPLIIISGLVMKISSPKEKEKENFNIKKDTINYIPETKTYFLPDADLPLKETPISIELNNSSTHAVEEKTNNLKGISESLFDLSTIKESTNKLNDFHGDVSPLIYCGLPYNQTEKLICSSNILLAMNELACKANTYGYENATAIESDHIKMSIKWKEKIIRHHADKNDLMNMFIETTNAGLGSLSPYDAVLTKREKIHDIQESLKISTLLHFTNANNLASIIKHGIYPKSDIHKINIIPEINDQLRLDGRNNGTSVSISFPNHKMLYKYRMENPSTSWVILIIQPSILWNKDCAFCKHNAADARISRLPLEKLKTPESFLDMFAEIEESNSRLEQNLQDCDPTDVQAEVLIFDIIEPHLIAGIVFDSTNTKNNFIDTINIDNYKTFVHADNKGLFASRSYIRKYS